MKYVKSVLVFLAAALFVAGCTNLSLNENSSSNSKERKNDSKKATVMIAFEGDSSRTALPSINWNDFTYTLTAIQNPGEAAQKDPVTLFTDRTKEQLVQGVTADLGKFKFTLTAKKDGTPSLVGTTTVTLTENTMLSFKMLAVSGGKGSAIVKINFPKDGAVTTVKAAYTTELFAQVEAEPLEIKVVSGVNTVTFSKENLPAATEQYAQFWFYDQTGTVVYSGIEALAVVGGCVSSSEITLTSADWHTYACAVTINKDGTPWAGSDKAVKLVNQTDSAKQYVLKDTSGGVYSASVSEGRYFIYVNDENTNIVFESVNKTADVSYWSVNLTTEKGCRLNVVSGGYDVTEKSANALKGSSFVYQILLSDGYKVSDGKSLVIKENGSAVSEPAFEKDFTISNVTAAQTIAVENLTTVNYTISYVDDNGNAISSVASDTSPYWSASYSAPAAFTVEAPAELPAILNVNLKGYKFDAWKDTETNETVKSTEGIYKNLILKAVWKDFIEIDKTSKTIYANGFNLLIVANGSATNVYADYDGDGVVDAGVDEMLSDSANIVDGSANTDFSNYHLTAGNSKGTKINSDFTFTMTGGTIASITGLGAASENKSVVNISGTSVIGSTESEMSVTDPDTGVKVTTAHMVNGINLDTITDQQINITGQMSGGYKIYLTTSRAYNPEDGIEYVVAYITNSNYADLKYFSCYSYDSSKDTGAADTKPYTKDYIKMKKFSENGVTRTKIILGTDTGVVLPETVIYDEATMEFSLGDAVMTTQCSVFSISVEKGTFRVNDRLTITEDTSEKDKQVEATLSYMAQPSPTEYRTSFSFSEQYIYMQVLSKGNALTEEIASSFLSQVYFKRDDPAVPLKITVNLETVPAEEISAANVQYFNGSFYAQYSSATGSAYYTWVGCYDQAKLKKFNGLNGYLMNVSSEVENQYIYTNSNFTSGVMSWTGGCCLPNSNGYDSETFGNTEKSPSYPNAYWKWQAGPEAGQSFWYKSAGASGNTEATVNTYRISDGEGGYIYARWNNKGLNNGGTGAEPNGVDETGCQFTTVNGLSGYWNDLDATKDNPTSSYRTKYYFVEFTPYEYIWNETTKDYSTPAPDPQKANYSAIKRSATY